MNGYSLQELADKMDNKVSKQALSKYELGAMLPEESVLPLLCKALGKEIDYFSKEPSIVLGAVSFRKIQSFTIREQEMIQEQTVDFLERYFELEKTIGIDSDFTNPLKNLPIRNSSDIEEAAAQLRKFWKVGEDPLNNTLELLEDMNIKVLESHAEFSFSGFSTFVSSRHPIIVINAKLDEYLERKRFTALHEVGHLLLDLEQYSDKEKESFCNAFASALLMPSKTLFSALGRNRRNILLKELLLLKQTFGVSIQAAVYRAKDLGIITESYFKSFMITMSKNGWRKNEPGKYEGYEKPNRFDQLLLRAVAEGIISPTKAVALSNKKLSDFTDEVD